ncbi:TetR/AcrR family transcriptional regulator [Terasakiella sp. A23]|uniref:TetR/AcrR family transcriptional regulator n=1 Tax=Terasakiella sp. FCG-A23 TaxID=3080561 RepID=UPI0029550995|nr:TetR/AcrR family transcriptional regulator [Terasakiella sp. A23]MDV7340295.1 TetR/AcrR family transcriptional regulator [Terasakiella sp. A23]
MVAKPIKRRSRIRERNEEAILKAAEVIFAQRGFGAATTAEIASAAGIPKANLHYYFKTKEDLYTHVLENILTTWLKAADDFDENHDPREALENYIRTKVDLSRTRPEASKIFAKEIISGAPFLKKHLQDDINPWMDAKIKIINGWIEQGKMGPVDVPHMFFLIWSMTQTYADFSTQMEIVLKKDKLDQKDFDTAANMIVSSIFSLCNLN